MRADRAQDRAHVPERPHATWRRTARATSPTGGWSSRPLAASASLSGRWAFHGKRSTPSRALGAARPRPPRDQLERLLARARGRARPATRPCATREAALDAHVADSLAGLEVAGAARARARSPTSARAPASPACPGGRAARARAWTCRVRRAARRAVIERLAQAAGIDERPRGHGARGGLGRAAALGGGARPTTSVTARALAPLAGAASSTRRRCCGGRRARGLEGAPRDAEEEAGGARRRAPGHGARARWPFAGARAPPPRLASSRHAAGSPRPGMARKRRSRHSQRPERARARPGDPGAGQASSASNLAAARSDAVRARSNSAEARRAEVRPRTASQTGAAFRPPPPYLRTPHGQRLRDRKPEGRGGQDHHRREPRRQRRRRRLPDPARRPRPAVQRHRCARAPEGRRARTSTTASAGELTLDAAALADGDRAPRRRSVHARPRRRERGAAADRRLGDAPARAARRRPRALPVHAARLPAVARARSRSTRSSPPTGDRAGADRVLRARGAGAAARHARR